MIYLLIISALIFILGGMFDQQRDVSKSNMSDYLAKGLNILYFFAGNGSPSSWVLKWQRDEKGVPLNPRKELFKGSSTVFVWKTDWFHLAKEIQIILIGVGFAFLSAAVSGLTNAKVYDFTICVVGFYPFYKFFNGIGFVLIESKTFFIHFIYFVQKKAQVLFENTQKNHT